MRAFLLLLGVLLLVPDAAHANPITAAISALATKFAATAVGTFLATTFGRILLSVALSALQPWRCGPDAERLPDLCIRYWRYSGPDARTPDHRR
jgi:hypothetical protein